MKTAPSIRTLNDEQNDKIQEMLSRSIYIRSKDEALSYSLKTIPLIDSFVRSYVNLFFCIQGQPLNPTTPELLESRHFTISSAISVRGSTNAALLQNEPLNADLDVVIKFSIPPPAFYDVSYFRSFCSMIGIYAFEMLLPDFSPTITMEQGGFLSCSSRSATLLDKTNGIFKSFFPFPDQSKCIYSFSGTRDDKGVITGLDLDITLQFRPEPKMRIFRPISPRSSSSSSSESFDSVAATPRWPEYGAQSFGHDAVELFLPSYIGTIQQSTRPFFVGMFGLNVECVEKLLSERSLMILDPDMHLGYRRLFYEITKGKTPKMDHPLDGEETENVVQILSHIQENPISKIKPGLEPFQQFVKSKSEDPNFAINFFMNAYMTVQLLISHLSSVEEPTPTQAARLCQIEHLLHVLEREFIHDTWQELFPPLTQRLSQIDNCIKAMMKIEQIKAHLTGFPENIVRHSLSQMVRIAGVPDKKHGFIISKSLNLDEIFLCLKHLKEHLGDDLFFQCTSDIYGPFGTLACTLQEKTILLYTMRRLEQKQLHADEVQSILSHLPLLVHLWNDHADFFQKHAKTNLLWAFIETHIAQILPSRCDRSLLLTCVLLSQKEQDKNPFVLPRMIRYFLHSSYISKDHIDSILCESILKSKKIHDISHAGDINVMKHLANLSQYTDEPGLRDIAELTKTLIEKVGDGLKIDEDTTRHLSIILHETLKRGMIPFLLHHEPLFSKYVDIDFFDAISARPDAFVMLPPSRQASIFSRALLEKKHIVVNELFSAFPLLSLSLFKQKAASTEGISERDIESICKSAAASQVLLSDTGWAFVLKKDQADAAHSLLSFLAQRGSSEALMQFVSSLCEKESSLALYTLFEAAEPLRQDILKGAPSLFHDLALLHLKDLTTEQKKCFYQVLFTTPDALIDHEPIIKTSILFFADKEKQIDDSSLELASFIEKIAPALQRAREKTDLATDPSYHAAIDYLQKLSKHISLSPTSTQILQNEMCECAPNDISCEEYISWAVNRAMTDHIVQVISKKISKGKLQEEVFIPLREYFKDTPKFLRNLLKMAEKSSIAKHHKEIGYRHLLLAEKNSAALQEDIKKVLSLRPSQKLSEQVVEAISEGPSMPLDATLSILEAMQSIDSSLFQSCLKKLITKSLQSKDSEKIQNSLFLMLHHHADMAPTCFFDLSLMILQEAGLVSKEELIKAVMAPTHVQGLVAAPLFEKLQQQPFSEEYVAYVKACMHIIAKHTYDDKDPCDLYPFIKAEILKTQGISFLVDEEHPDPRKKEVHQSTCDMVKAFLPQIITKHPDDLSLIWSTFTVDDFLQILPHLAKYTDRIPLSFIEDTMDIFARSEQEIRIDSLSCHMKTLTEDFCIRAEGEKALIIAMLFKKICPMERGHQYLVSILFSKLLKIKNAHLLNLLKTEFMDALSGKDMEKKKKSFKAELQAAVHATKPCDAIQYSDITILFSDYLNLETKRLILQILKQKCKTIPEEADFSALLILFAAFHKNIFSTLTTDEKESLQKDFFRHYEKISFESFFDARHRLSHPVLQCVLSDLTKKLFKTFGDRFIENILKQTQSEALYADMHLVALYLNSAEYFRPEALISVQQAIDEKIKHLASSPSHDPFYVKCLTGLLHLLIQVSVNTPFLDKAHQTVAETTPLVSGDNFTYTFDDFHLLSFNTCVQSTGDASLFIPLMEQLYIKLQKDEVSKEAKKKLVSHFLSNFLPVIFMSDDCSALPAEKILLPLMKLSEDIPISTEHFNVIISLFLQFVDESIEKVTIEQPQAAAEVRHSHLYALSPKSPSSIELVHLQLSQIRSHLSPSISIKNIMRLFKGISLVAQCQAWVDEKTLSEISKICEKALHIVLHSEHLQVGMVECLAKWNDPAFQIQQSSLHEPACLFLVATPVIIHNLRKLKEKTAPDHSIDIQKLQRLQREFLIKIDDVLVKKSNKSIDQIIFIYKAIHSNAVEAVLNFMDGFFDYCQVDGGIERSLQNCRILMGLGYFITQDLGTKMMISSHPQIQRECEVLDQSLQNITQLIFSLLQTIISKGMGLRGLRLDEIMKTGIQTFLIHPEDGLERLYNMIEKILHAELKRPNPDPNVILSILEYMADISDMQHFNANTKIKMRELALRLWDPSKLNTKLEGCVDLVIPTKVKASLQPHFTSKILSLFSQKSETKPSVEPRRGLASSALEGMMQNIALPEIASQARAAAEPKTDVAPKEEAVGFSKFLTTIMSGFFSS